MRFSASEIDAAIKRIDNVDAYGGANLIESEGVVPTSVIAEEIWNGAQAGQLSFSDAIWSVFMVGLCVGVALADGEAESRRDFEKALGL